MKLAIAIISPNTLAAIGLAHIIQRMMPSAQPCLFAHFAQLAAHAESEDFFHYFVSADELLNGAAWFLTRQHKTIVLVYGEQTQHLPQGFHTLNVCQDEERLVKNIISLAHRSHMAHGSMPEAVRQAELPNDKKATQKPRLSPREREVLQGIVKGLINKEIADQMGVKLATVITHRKHIVEKIGTRSVSALTIYAVSHGIVRSEDI